MTAKAAIPEPEPPAAAPSAGAGLANPAALRAAADPTRVRIMLETIHAARTVKELATILGVPPTRLYYHVGILEEHGLLRVASRRMVSGIEERRYEAVRDSLTVSPDLKLGELRSAGVATALLAAVQSEVEVALQDDLGGQLSDSGSALPMMAMTGLALTADQVDEFRDRLEAVIDDYLDDRSDVPPDARIYHLLVVAYRRPEARHAP